MPSSLLAPGEVSGGGRHVGFLGLDLTKAYAGFDRKPTCRAEAYAVFKGGKGNQFLDRFPGPIKNDMRAFMLRVIRYYGLITPYTRIFVPRLINSAFLSDGGGRISSHYRFSFPPQKSLSLEAQLLTVLRNHHPIEASDYNCILVNCDRRRSR
jgi:hypothetical protein